MAGRSVLAGLENLFQSICVHTSIVVAGVSERRQGGCGVLCRGGVAVRCGAGAGVLSIMRVYSQLVV